MNFFRFFLILEIFFFGFGKTIKSHEIWICFRKKSTHYTKEVLDNRSKWFANTTQLFFDKRCFQKLKKNWKNLYVFGQIDKSICAKKKLRYRFFCWTIFLFYSFVNFLELLICKINVLSTFWMVDFLKIFVPSGSIQKTLWISLLAGNVTTHPERYA